MFVRPRGKPVRRIRTVLANRCKNEAAALTGPDRGRIGIVEEDEGPGASGNRGRGVGTKVDGIAKAAADDAARVVANLAELNRTQSRRAGQQKDEPGVPHGDLVAVPQTVLGYGSAVDVGAIVAAEVAQEPAAIFRSQDDAMAPGHGRIGDRDLSGCFTGRSMSRRRVTAANGF